MPVHPVRNTVVLIVAIVALGLFMRWWVNTPPPSNTSRPCGELVQSRYGDWCR